MGLLLVPLLTLACATPDAPKPDEETPAVQTPRTFRDRLVLGPDSMNHIGARLTWAATIGLLTSPVWIPGLAYDGYKALGGEGEAIFVVGRGRIGFSERSRLGDVALQPPSVASPQIPPIEFGSYHALLIGNNDYRHLARLATAINDARSVAAVLRDGYGFETGLLLDATRAQIVYGLYELRGQLTSDDNLLVYYAGHGQLDDETGEGYWLPVDAGADDPARWLANSTIATMLKAIPARHILLVVDSCFAGSLNRSSLPPRLRRQDHIAKLRSKRARMVMTSGGLEPVADSGGEGHSIFAKSLLQVLESNTGVLDGSSVFLEIRRSVGDNAYQTPEYGPIRFTGHDGGDFLFVRRAGRPPR